MIMSDDAYTYRKFGGKKYGVHAIRQTRVQANAVAKKARKAGYLARVIKVPGFKLGKPTGIVWLVYTRWAQ